MAHHFKAYHLNAGCCTRCSTPISSAYVVPENVYWRFIGDCGLYQKQAAPVCETCVTPFEANGCRAPSPCEGCGMTLRMHWRYSSRFCSEAWRQKASTGRARRNRVCRVPYDVSIRRSAAQAASSGHIDGAVPFNYPARSALAECTAPMAQPRNSSRSFAEPTTE